MRFRLSVAGLIFAVIASTAVAKELWIPIAGNAQGGNFFRTDLRILNPSFAKDITIAASYLPVEKDNTSAPSVQITIPKRQMIAYDNVVSSLFNTSGFGAIRFTSADDFTVTSRTFADNPCSSGGIFGQFIPGFQLSQALTKGTIIQLSVSPDFRSNAGFANPNPTAASIALVLYGSNNEVVNSASIDIPPFGARILGLPSISGIPNLNVANAWISFSSNVPVIGYGSVVDNRSADQIFIAASEDSGSPPPPTPPANLTVEVGPGLTFTPGNITVKVGDTVTWVFRAFHTTTSDARTGAEVWDSGSKSSGSFAHKFTTPGTYPYYCAIHSFAGGTAMNAVVHVEEPAPRGY